VPGTRPASRPKLPRALPKTVLFDMDDTIFDHSLTCRAALAQLRREVPALRGPTLDAMWNEYNRLLGATHTDVMLGRRSSEAVRAERLQRLATWAGHVIDASEAAELSRVYREHYQSLRRPVPGAPEMVRRLRGRTRVGVVTNNTVAEQTQKLAFLGLQGEVDFLVTSEEVGAAKPDPSIFRAALERAGAAPKEAVMIGDSWTSDVAGARSAGIRAVWFNRFRVPRPPGAPVPEFDSFRSPLRVERLLAPPGRIRPAG
jgi:HAD superfamily hydrolase (TIGR01549 family)